MCLVLAVVFGITAYLFFQNALLGPAFISAAVAAVFFLLLSIRIIKHRKELFSRNKNP